MSLDPALRQRIDELLAANHVVLFMKGQPDAPQCGFSSTEEGNIMTEEEQWAKVRLVVEIAREVWQDA